MLASFRSPYDATVIEKLHAAGMSILGRLNMDEFAMGGSTENSAFGVTRNPWKLDCVPGGSSGGSAAAVAAGMAPAALGSDTGGSIRQPASFCGVVGVKPAYGAVSRYGLVAFASSLDQIGPLCKTVADAALVLDVICGGDPRDMTSDPALARPCAGREMQDLSGLTVGLPAECFGEGLDAQVRAAVEAAAGTLRGLGAQVRKVSLPSLPYALPAYYVLSSAEASSNLARYDGVRYGYRAQAYADLDELYRKSRQEGFGAEVKRRICWAPSPSAAAIRTSTTSRRSRRANCCATRQPRRLAAAPPCSPPWRPPRLTAWVKRRAIPWKCTWATSIPCRPTSPDCPRCRCRADGRRRGCPSA